MSEEQDSGEAKGFSVKDKRRFSTDGEAREDLPDEREEERAAPAEGAAPRKGELPAIDFSTFILSLSTSTMVHLGEAPSPDGRTHKDLSLAKQSIDILVLLRDKTVGNLNSEEEKLLAELLYDLRLRYVRAAAR